MKKLAVQPIADIQRFCQNTMIDTLGIRFTRMGEDFVEAEMPVDHRTHQAMVKATGKKLALRRQLPRKRLLRFREGRQPLCDGR